MRDINCYVVNISFLKVFSCIWGFYVSLFFNRCEIDLKEFIFRRGGERVGVGFGSNCVC